MTPRTFPRLVDAPVEPEHLLRQSFKREDELLAELAQIRAEQREHRNSYAAAHGLLIRPSVEQLRRILHDHR